jgi:tRNA pseudouridine38-40 synthase
MGSPEQNSLYRLLLAYEGSSFSGWQIQPYGRTIQGTLEEALAKPLGLRASVVGSSRTDAGVHAQGQVVHFYAPENVEIERLVHSLNGLLPESIRCRGGARAAKGFHSQLSARKKCYQYCLQIGRVQDPLLRQVTVLWNRPFSLVRFREAAEQFVGTHDFTALANENHRGAAARNAVRTVEKIEVSVEGDRILTTFIGNGFLYKQVRNMMGAMLAVAAGEVLPDQIPLWILAKDRRSLPPPAPAQGLCLQWIDYGTSLEWQGGEFCL